MTRCWLSENHVAVTTSGRVLPCTRYKKTEGPNIADDNLHNIFNGPWIGEIRSQLQDGIKIDGCRKCWHDEDANVESMRQQFSSKGKWKSKLQSIELAFSNHCNYSCRHCNSFSSSKWYEDDKLLGRPLPNKKLVVFDIEKINNIDDIKYYKFLGGEPLLNKSHDELLLRIKNVEQVTFEYTTNGSVLPKKEILDIWKRAKNVIVSVSLDDVFEGFEYFRTGGNFEQVINTCNKLNEYNFILTFHVVLNALNLHRMPEILNFIKNNFPNWNVHFDTVNLPKYLRTGQWSKYEAEQILKQISNDRLSKLIKIECTNEYTNLEEFFKVNKILDKSRKTNLLNVHPVFQKYVDYQDYCNDL
jgi:radical SAM protein with 4Fe4S-binding SPASM domain